MEVPTAPRATLDRMANVSVQPSTPYHCYYDSNHLTVVADLQALAATASGYQYPDGALGPNGGYGQQHPGGAPAGFYGGPPQNSAYGPVYYAVNQTQQLNNDYEIRKRAAYDALNEFFGDAKRRAIDPTTYYDVGQRLMGLQSVQLPVLGGGYQGAGMSEYGGHGGTMVAQAQHPPMHHPYSLPLPNLRTKSDLLNIDQFLEQLQSTVYENPNHAAAAGVQHGHQMYTGAGYRSSNSPPGLSSSHSQSSHATAIGSSSVDTPALTPASSVLSYGSQHSPGAAHSASNVSPTSRSSISSMYPTLPSVSAMSDMSAAAPSSGLAPAFDADGRRRFSGNLLQKAAPDRRGSDSMDTTDDGAILKVDSEDSLHHNVNQLVIHSPKVDPALRSPSVASSTATETGDSSQQSWVENIRVIERLRAYLKDRLDSHEYSDEDNNDVKHEQERRMSDDDAHNLYPVLRAVQEGRE